MNRFCFAFLFALSVCAFADEPTVDECSREVLFAYYPEPFVKETLKKYNVPENQWNAIYGELAAKNGEIVERVEVKAKQLDIDPLKDPAKREEAIKLFQDTLYEVFADVMKAHNIQDPNQIQAMHAAIQDQKAERFADCIQKREVPVPEGAADNDDDDDEDDNDS